MNQKEIQTLIDQSEALQELIPEQWRGLISGFGEQAVSGNLVDSPKVTVYSG